jgi:hypothetical protein
MENYVTNLTGAYGEKHGYHMVLRAVWTKDRKDALAATAQQHRLKY